MLNDTVKVIALTINVVFEKFISESKFTEFELYLTLFSYLLCSTLRLLM